MFTQTDKCELLLTPRIAGVWVGVRVLTWPWVMVTRLLSLLVMQCPSCHTGISDPSNRPTIAFNT